ncbi:MAG: hypothetical protein ACLR6W_09700 [Evtepia sp.]
MKNRTIAWSQLSAVLLLALLPLGTELLPGRLAQVGAAAWLCPLLAGVGVVALGLLVSRRCPPGRRDWGQRVTRRWGRRTARVLAGVFLLWGLFLAAAHAERIGSRLSDSLRAAPVLLTAAVLLLAGWMAAGGLPAFARACEVFLLAVGAGFVLILLFGIFRLDWSLTLLWTREELAQVPAGALSTAGTMAVGGYALFLLGDVRPEAGGADGMLRRLALLFALLAGAVLLVLGQLGSALAAQVDGPFSKWSPAWGLRGLSSGWRSWSPPCGCWGMWPCWGCCCCAWGGCWPGCWTARWGRGSPGCSPGRCFSWGCPPRWGTIPWQGPGCPLGTWRW